jgi:hypothetical protein
MVLLRDFGQVKTRFGPFGDVLISTQDRYTVCAKRTIGLEIILDAPNYTPQATWIKWKLISIHFEII